MQLDVSTQAVLVAIYEKLKTNEEIYLSSPEYKQTQIDALVESGLLKKIDASDLSGWAYIVRPTYAGETYFSQIHSPNMSKVKEFISRGEEIGEKEYYSSGNGFPFSYVSGPLYDAWMGEINIFNERYLKDHPLYKSISSTYFHRKNSPSAYNDMMGYLRALVADSDFFPAVTQSMPIGLERENMNRKVFIVHGHDNEAKQELARTLEKAGFEVIILHEQADAGLTIIEKIERYTDVAFAVILYTQCDLGRAKEDSVDSEKYRARQNVVFEHGYLIGKLHRDHVCALVKGNVETPGDISGVVYVPMDSNGAWKMNLAKNMKAAGLPIDMNKFWS